jgi:polyhydroxybutyrate depolymerase
MKAHRLGRLAAATLLVLPLLAPRPGLAQGAPKCVAAKLKAIGKNEKAALTCVAKVVAKNDPSSLSGCLAKADAKLSSAFAKAIGCDGSLAACAGLADDCVDAVTAALPDAGPSPCEAARLKAAGKKAAHRLTCHAKAATKGVAVDTACLDKASVKFAAAWAKTSGCSGDATTVENVVDETCVDALVTLSAGTVTGICGSTATTTTTVSSTTTTTGDDPIASRPYLSVVPSSYSPGTPMPLVVLLHGYGANAVLQNGYFKLSTAAEAKGFLYAYPDGTVDNAGRRFWNATDACCNFFGSTVDDVGYLAAVIADMKSKYTVDAGRVFVVGHSNGGFMAYRLACELSSEVTGIMALAGATWNDPADCQPSLPVTVLHIHGDEDDTILYGGGSAGGNPYPSAAVSASTWASYNGCSPTTNSLPPIDIDSFLTGAETTRISYDDGCTAGSAVQLWTIEGEGHVPPFNPTWFDPVYAYLMAHPRP